MTPAASGNYFELFQLPQDFRLDLGKLDSHYLELQTRVHPDKSAHLSDAEKRLSLQWATLANEAYQTLKRPLDRARYLLKIHGIDTQEENNTAMPTEFLLEQIEWREELQGAVVLRNLDALERLSARLKTETDSLFDSLGSLLEDERQHPAAAVIVRQLAFLEKLGRDINDALATLED
ncbi:Fe-S protein assembly co-chaperone HscB [Methylococcus sp. EFPC2]|uniref:Fe-S protein assembly co-chaperone HscB n=1 Tax=Methylococcus sp. EFPC2 TaxID=2812648 RepID=UPI001966DED2|nr:Fe-S protein assembly co-chaperone HscB [Methylococcus sp. EFPC2]QSA99225.1 Fe-S protein assembly co-chaperone HscB [Methylococcus sp. EFPC2]